MVEICSRKRVDGPSQPGCSNTTCSRPAEVRHVDAIDSTSCMGCGLTHVDWRLLTGKEVVVVQETHVGCETQKGPFSLNLAVKVVYKDIDDNRFLLACSPAAQLDIWRPCGQGAY